MSDCGVVLHNVETKQLYDFLALEKCRNFSQAAISHNVSQPTFGRRTRALEQAIGVELFDRQVTPLQLSEQGRIFRLQIRRLLQQLESSLAELRSGSDYAQRKTEIAAVHSLSLGLLPSIISRMSPLLAWAIEAIDVDEAADKLHEEQSGYILSSHNEDLLEAPLNHIRLFESQLPPACVSGEHGEALFGLAQPHFPLLSYNRNPYMGRLINRTLMHHDELSFSTFFVSSMSELLEQAALDGCGTAWPPEYIIQQETHSGQLVVLNRNELMIPVQAYTYQMNTRMDPIAERFWHELHKLEIVLS